MKSKTSSSATNQNNTSAASQAESDPRERIAAAAYFKAEARGFAPGAEMDDWLQAEAEAQHQASAAG